MPPKSKGNFLRCEIDRSSKGILPQRRPEKKVYFDNDDCDFKANIDVDKKLNLKCSEMDAVDAMLLEHEKRMAELDEKLNKCLNLGEQAIQKASKSASNPNELDLLLIPSVQNLIFKFYVDSGIADSSDDSDYDACTSHTRKPEGTDVRRALAKCIGELKQKGNQLAPQNKKRAKSVIEKNRRKPNHKLVFNSSCDSVPSCSEKASKSSCNSLHPGSEKNDSVCVLFCQPDGRDSNPRSKEQEEYELFCDLARCIGECINPNDLDDCDQKPMKPTEMISNLIRRLKCCLNKPNSQRAQKLKRDIPMRKDGRNKPDYGNDACREMEHAKKASSSPSICLPQPKKVQANVRACEKDQPAPKIKPRSKSPVCVVQLKQPAGNKILDSSSSNGSHFEDAVKSKGALIGHALVRCLKACSPKRGRTPTPINLNRIKSPQTIKSHKCNLCPDVQKKPAAQDVNNRNFAKCLDGLRQRQQKPEQKKPCALQHACLSPLCKICKQRVPHNENKSVQMHSQKPRAPKRHESDNNLNIKGKELGECGSYCKAEFKQATCKTRHWDKAAHEFVRNRK